MVAAGGRLRRSDRLRSPGDFRRLGREGARRASRHFVVLLAHPPAGAAPRLGITVSRKVGNAVKRNRVKRRIREWFRCWRGQRAPAQDLVVIARRGAAELDARAFRAELDGLLR